MLTQKQRRKSAPEHAISTVKKLLKLRNIQYSNRFLRENLREHPDFPSLLSINDYLCKLSINTEVLNVPFENVGLIPSLSFSYLTDYLVGEKYFTIIKEVNESEITYSNHLGDWYTESLDDFKDKWEGPTILLESNEDAGEFQLEKNVYQDKEELLLHRSMYFLLLLLVLIMPATADSIEIFGFFLLKVAGSLVTSMLLIKELGLNVAFINRICTLNGISKNVGCYKVISSKASKLFSFINMTDIGLIYFASGLIQLFIFSVSGRLELFFLTQSLSLIITLPYSVFSIFYQLKVVKSWCPFCLITMALFWLEASLLWWSLDGSIKALINDAKIVDVTTLIFSFSLPALFLFLFRDFFNNSISETSLLKRQLSIFKSSPVAIQALLRENSQNISSEEFGSDIVLGNPEAEHRIIIVLSAYCPYCEHLVTEVRDFIQAVQTAKITFRFAAHNALNSEFSSYILAYGSNHSSKDTFRCVESWYALTDKNLELFNKNVLKISEFDYNLIVEAKTAWENWRNENGIAYTPAIIVDGHIMPRFLKLEDFLFYFNSPLELNEYA